MFYSIDVLTRKGRFGKIWLAAHFQHKLTKLDILGTNIPRTCDDLLNIICRPAGDPQRHYTRLRFSLYLSSQLMYGIVYIHYRQAAILHAEALKLNSDFTFSLKRNILNINLTDRSTEKTVTLQDPILDDDYDFGLIRNVPEVLRGFGDDGRPPYDLHQSPPGAITIPEIDDRHSQEPGEDDYLPPLTSEVLETFGDNIGDQVVQPPVVEPIVEPVVIETETVPSPDHSGGPEEPVVLPVVADGDGVVDVPPPVVPPVVGDGDGVVDVPPPVVPPVVGDGNGVVDVPPPVVPPVNGDGQVRRRRRRPVFDVITTIPNNETRANLANNYSHCRVNSRDDVRAFIRNQFYDNLRRVTPDHLFRGPGMGRRTTRNGRFQDAPIAENSRRFFTRHLNTRPEPDEPEAPSEVSDSASPFSFDEATPLPVASPPTGRTPSPEERRTSESDVEEQPARISDVVVEKSHDPVTGISHVPPVDEEVTSPLPRIVEEPRRRTTRAPRTRGTQPEQPASSSGEQSQDSSSQGTQTPIPTAREIEDLINEVREQEQLHGRRLTFRRLCPPPTNTRIQAALTFLHVLNLHMERRVFLEQDPPHTLQTEEFSDIFID